MASSKSKTIPWTYKHDAFCREQGIPPAAQYLWRWLMSEGKIGSEIYPDLTEFNKRVAKERGKPYTRQTLKDAFKKLVDCRVITVVRQFCWKVSQIVIRPLDWLFPQKNLYCPKEICGSPPSNPDKVDENFEEEKQQQLNLYSRRVDKLCLHHGLDFDTNCNAFKEVLTYTWNDISWALQYLKDQIKRNFVSNPRGYLLSTLRYGWHKTGNWIPEHPNCLPPQPED